MGDKNTSPRAERANEAKNVNKQTTEKVRLCFRCGQPGHIASNPICPENGKKPSYAQIRAAHSIIMDAVSESIGAEEHPCSSEDSSEEEVQSSSSSIDHIEFKVYEDDEYSETEADGCKDRMHNMEYTSDASLGPENKADSSEDEDEIVYRNPMAEPEERIETVPLFEFSGLIPEIVEKSFRDVRMTMSPTARSETIDMAAMTDAVGTVQQQGKIRLRIQKDSYNHPITADKRCLVTLLQVNGLEAVTLWDSGSTSTAMSPAFADISKALVSRLRNLVILQLGTVGSRARINFGTTSTITSQGYSGPEYFDVINIDKYDVIVGTPFMHCNKVVLDFENKCVIVNGSKLAGKVLDGEEADKIARQHCMCRPDEQAR